MDEFKRQWKDRLRIARESPQGHSPAPETVMREAEYDYRDYENEYSMGEEEPYGGEKLQEETESFGVTRMGFQKKSSFKNAQGDIQKIEGFCAQNAVGAREKLLR